MISLSRNLRDGVLSDRNREEFTEITSFFCFNYNNHVIQQAAVSTTIIVATRFAQH